MGTAGHRRRGQHRIRGRDAVLVVIAVLMVTLSLLSWQSDNLTRTGVARFGVVVALAAVAQLAAVHLRVGAARLRLGWGEAAVILGLYLLPSGWVPLAALLGVAIARSVDRLLGLPTTLWRATVNVGALTISAWVATLVACLIHHPFSGPVDGRTAAALIVAAMAYFVTSVALVAIQAAARSGVDYLVVVRGTLVGKAYMLVGNTAVGMIAVAVLDARMTWFIVLTPLLWVLRLTFRSQLLIAGDRVSWQLFADAQQELSQPDETAVMHAAIDGLVRVFGVTGVRAWIIGSDGQRREYGYPGPGDGPPVRQPLLASGALVGELELTRPDPLRPRERAQLAVFAGAIAVAARDAAKQDELRDLTLRRAYEAAHDPLTTLLNRDGFAIAGERLLRQLGPGASVALVLLDANDFKRVNETLGHAGGDDLLRVAARRMRATAGSEDVVARLDADGFALLAPVFRGIDGEPVDSVSRRARDLAEQLSNPIDASGSPVVVEFSAGVAAAAVGECSLAELLRRADVALHRGKKARLPVTVFEPGIETASVDRLLLLAELHEALDADDQLFLLLQPIVDLRSGDPVGVEALVRWNHPRHREMTPERFLDVVEDSELVGRFTRYVLDLALTIAAGWRAEGLRLPISVNLSARSLRDPSLPGDVARLLRRHRVPADQLTLEITETVMEPKSPVVLAALNALRDLGVRLSVDDLGTGFSSLTFITTVQVDEVKVDRSFVARIVDSAEVAAIVRTILEIAHNKRLRVVAEGVETVAQKDWLTDSGCVAAQGYHFFRPMLPENARAAVRALLAGGGTGNVLPLRADEAS